MSKDKNIDFSKVAAHIIKTPLQNFVEESYLPYAHYVIMSRALISDDGLKPVQRRILYAMDQLGLTDKKDFIKAAQIVGETMGKYHPHGDASIGDALARMGQDFTLRVPLVDVQGSVGFTTGDDPAAPRYWEGRPTKAAMELTKELKEGAIEMGLNYDGKYPEPPMLPVRWPNGIINGSQGIAVGYSSNIVPHNPTEVMDALIAMVKDPDITIDEIMEIMPGPDMPTGGVLLGYEGVKDYYETGRGTFSIRGKYSIEPGARGTHQIIFHEAPYQVSAEQIVSSVAKNKKDRDRFKEISQVKDLSDINNGFKLSVSVKAGANPEVVLSDLFKWTPLEQKFSVNMTVLKDGVPSVNSIKDMLENFIEFRSQCIVNKSQYRLDELNKEIERLDGIIKVLVDIDKAIEIIRKSEDTKVANEKLQKKFKINDEQATFILSMPLRRLTKSDSLSIQNEIKDLKEEQKYITKLLKDEKVFNKHLIDELEETKKVIADERRTEIVNKSQEELKKEAARLRKAAAKDAKNTECYVTLFADDTVTRTEEPYKQERSPKAIVAQIKTGTQENLVFVTKDGNALKLPVTYISENNIVDVDVTTGLPKDSVAGIGKEKPEKGEHGTLIVTSKGGVNIVNGGVPVSQEFQITKLDDDEEVIYATWLTKKDVKDKAIVLVSSDGYVLKFPLEQIRTSNSGAGTVRGMNLNDGERVAGASIADPENAEIVSCSYKSIKVTDINEIPGRNRGAKGLILHRLQKDDEILSAFASEKVVANKNGRSLKLPEVSERALTGTKRSGTGISLGHLALHKES